jgi:iron uptake system component EfeO
MKPRALRRFCAATARAAIGAFVVTNGVGGMLSICAAASEQTSPAPVRVDVTASNCEPNELNVAAGDVSFSIHNASPRALEWEILDGVMVVAERENIPAGSTQSLTSKLKPGDYQITCGLISNPRGRLHVAGSPGASPKLSLVDLIGSLAEYRVFATYEVDGLMEETGRLADALKSGDLKSARASYAAAHAHYARIAPIAMFFPDLDGDDSGAAERDDGRLDPSSPGFRPLKRALFVNVRPRDYRDFADKLVEAVRAMQARFRSSQLTPAPIIAGAVEVMGGVAPEALGDAVVGGNDTNMADVRADVDGVREIVDLFRPLVLEADASLSHALEDDLASLDAALNKHATSGDGYAPSVSLTPEERTVLQDLMRKLSRDLSLVSGTLGFG